VAWGDSHRVQGQEEPLANLVIGESCSDQSEDFQLAVTQWRDQRLARMPSASMFVVVLLRIEYGQQSRDVGRHPETNGRSRQQLGHRYAFVDKAADESAWLSDRQRVNEHLRGLVPIGMRVQCQRLEHHDREPFIRPTFCLHLLSPGFEGG
jgi:hypothetical protein